MYIYVYCFITWINNYDIDQESVTFLKQRYDFSISFGD